ncbi:claudin-10-like isoform X2 [Osmerus mordax]|uniref:claudin-10-like isoform X2 n=1 Tax=Osmerus mordax TaxID=8014 RepID=UPI00350FBEEA
MGNMVTEILAFILSTSGWVLVCSTLPTEYWKVSSLDGTVITTATYWSNLWRACVTDSTGVFNCKDFPSMLALEGYIQVCRGLMIAAICLGFFGAIFALVGMKCTKIGGSDQNKARIAFVSGVNFILSGLCSLSACSLYAHRITSEFFDPMFVAQKWVTNSKCHTARCHITGWVLTAQVATVTKAPPRVSRPTPGLMHSPYTRNLPLTTATLPERSTLTKMPMCKKKDAELL